MRRSSCLTLTLATVALAAACSGEPEPVATATELFPSPSATTTAAVETPTPTPTATATATPEPTEREVDAAYVTDFMAQANVVTQRAHQQVRTTGATADAATTLELAGTPGFTTRLLEGLERAGGADILAEDVGVPTSTTIAVLQADESCILALVDHDPTPMFRDDFAGPTARPFHVLLTPGTANEDVSLPWRIDELVSFDGADGPTSCDGFTREDPA